MGILYTSFKQMYTLFVKIMKIIVRVRAFYTVKGLRDYLLGQVLGLFLALFTILVLLMTARPIIIFNNVISVSLQTSPLGLNTVESKRVL